MQERLALLARERRVGIRQDEPDRREEVGLARAVASDEEVEAGSVGAGGEGQLLDRASERKRSEEAREEDGRERVDGRLVPVRLEALDLQGESSAQVSLTGSPLQAVQSWCPKRWGESTR